MTGCGVALRSGLWSALHSTLRTTGPTRRRRPIPPATWVRGLSQALTSSLATGLSS